MSTETTELAKRPIEMTDGGMVLHTLDEAWRFAQYVLASGMAPKGYTKPEAVIIAIQRGGEVGLKPMQALDSIAVINGRATLWGDALPGLLWGSGLLEDMIEECDGTTATCTLKRRDAPTPITRTFSIDDAKSAGLWGKAGPWTQYPRRMLQMRARSWAARDGFADVLRGLQVREEVQDYREQRETVRVESSEPPRLSLLPSNQDATESQSEPEVFDAVPQVDPSDVLADLTDAAAKAQTLEVLNGVQCEIEQAVQLGDITPEQGKVIRQVAALTEKRLATAAKSGELFQ